MRRLGVPLLSEPLSRVDILHYSRSGLGARGAVFVCLLATFISSDRNTSLRVESHCSAKHRG